MNEIALRQLIGRMASLDGPDEHLLEWASRTGENLFIVPVLPNDGLNESIAVIHKNGRRSGVLVTAAAPQEGNHVVLRWVTVESAHSHDDSGHLPTTPATTVGDLLRFLQPGSSMTIRLGNDEFVFQPDTSQTHFPEGQIADQSAVRSLRKAIAV